MPNQPPSNDRNHDTPVTKSESQTPKLKRKLDFDDRLVTISVSDLDRIKHMLEAPSTIPSLTVEPSSTVMEGRFGNIDHATSCKIRQNKDSLTEKQDRQRSAPDTLPFPGRAETSPQPPIVAAYHDIPSPRYPPSDLTQHISDYRQVLEAQARDVERALRVDNSEKRQPQSYAVTGEQKAILDRIQAAQIGKSSKL
ncbi:hypothetical protein FGRMN_1724 [Fusarium graminum]|nr:hypothetical protein FGRMN_1724 [Fusarium graminum]